MSSMRAKHPVVLARGSPQRGLTLSAEANCRPVKMVSSLLAEAEKFLVRSLPGLVNQKPNDLALAKSLSPP